ncbi:unnamed protein product [Albugo candida]|uniref:EGF-like domain-containing protein n=1 Tax=Albugo candida TaxID=65357 RepID=A0A024G0C6_9STRA|nr:unnamed protein product [Albugo candida]|eukprot:CCI39765.1 unnamed protein product [Albugo candida]
MRRAQLISLSIFLGHFVGNASEETLKFKYYCTSDSYCASKFPGTVCISVEQYGDVIRKCTPNTITRPACRQDRSGLCPSYQRPELGYLNAHCIFVADSIKLEKDSGSNRMLASNDSENGTQAPAIIQKEDANEDEKYAEILIGNKTVRGIYKCVDAADCANQAYNPSDCESAKCGQLAGPTNVCSYHGTCTYKTSSNISSRVCSCSAGFDGSKCERTLSGACDVDCGVGGDCVSGSCMCKAGYDGKITITHVMLKRGLAPVVQATAVPRADLPKILAQRKTAEKEIARLERTERQFVTARYVLPNAAFVQQALVLIVFLIPSAMEYPTRWYCCAQSLG